MKKMSIKNFAKKRATGIAFKLSLPSQESAEEEKRPDSVEKGLELLERFDSNDLFKPLGIYKKEVLIKKTESFWEEMKVKKINKS